MNKKFNIVGLLWIQINHHSLYTIYMRAFILNICVKYSLRRRSRVCGAENYLTYKISIVMDDTMICVNENVSKCL